LQGRAKTVNIISDTITTDEQTKQAMDRHVVCKDYLDIAIHPEGKTFRLANNAPGQAKLVQKLSSYQIEGIVLETTGGIERAVMSALEVSIDQINCPLTINIIASRTSLLVRVG
jgi:hypothetical protein